MRVQLWTVALLAAASAHLACGKSTEAEGGPPEGGAPQQMPPPEVSVVTIGTQRVALTTELPGRTSPFLVAEVRPQVGGLILKRLFLEGADVKAGDLLYEIDASSYEVALSMARATLAGAEAGLSTTATRARRFHALADAVSKQERDDATGGVRASKAHVAAARAAIEAAKLDLERTRVLAPIGGRIGRSSVMQGTLVTPYQTTLAVVQQLDPIYVDITRSSVEVLRLKRALASGKLARPGGEDGAKAAKVMLMLEDGTPYQHEGKLEFADASVDPNTGAITLRAVFPNPDNDLLPGMYVRALLEEGVAEKALLVPQQGVTRDPKGNPVALVVTKEGMVEPRILTVDRTVGDQWLVTAGIAAGDQVIVEGLQKVRPGAPASPVPFKAADAPLGGAPPGGAPPGAPAPDDKKPDAAKPEAPTEPKPATDGAP